MTGAALVAAVPLMNLPAEDLQRCHTLLGSASWQALAGKRIFIAGGTGFVGKWLLATLLDADATFALQCRITVLSRNPSLFARSWPDVAQRVSWITGDIRNFDIGAESFDVIVHAATDVVAGSLPEDIFSTCLDGTRRVLSMARRCGASGLLLLSSGAVYGPLPAGLTHVPETYIGGPDTLLANSAYGEGKRAAEWLVAQAGREGLQVKIARVFAVVGPHLALDKHFAIGNFLGAALQGSDIVVNGDGTPHRSYLYAADMAAWLWAILLRGPSGRAYNVGAEESLSILDLARRVAAEVGDGIEVRALKSADLAKVAEHYVPDTQRIRTELHLPDPLPLNEAIRRTANWHLDTALGANAV